MECLPYTFNCLGRGIGSLICPTSLQIFADIMKMQKYTVNYKIVPGESNKNKKFNNASRKAFKVNNLPTSNLRICYNESQGGIMRHLVSHIQTQEVAIYSSTNESMCFLIAVVMAWNDHVQNQ